VCNSVDNVRDLRISEAQSPHISQSLQDYNTESNLFCDVHRQSDQGGLLYITGFFRIWLVIELALIVLSPVDVQLITNCLFLGGGKVIYYLFSIVTTFVVTITILLHFL
jgi:hypothetical protein